MVLKNNVAANLEEKREEIKKDFEKVGVLLKTAVFWMSCPATKRFHRKKPLSIYKSHRVLMTIFACSNVIIIYYFL